MGRTRFYLVLALTLCVVTVAPGAASAADRFVDVPLSSEFHDDIEVMAEEGWTLGCDPPTFDRFCPRDVVTRGQMVVVLWRYFAPPRRPYADRFVDDEDTFYERAANWAFEVGLTVGCDPPTSDRFCGDRALTRAEFATFVRRAFDRPFTGFPTSADEDRFVDDDGSVHEENIDLLAATGLTRGCNPPANDRFCPDDPLTRGQLAALFVRAGRAFQPV